MKLSVYVIFLCRYMHTLKLSVGNEAPLEGSIVEAYILNECLTFRSMYLNNTETNSIGLRGTTETNFKKGCQFFRTTVDSSEKQITCDS